MKRVTLGGDRIGSGKKMKVDLHSYERSTHNLSKTWKSTMSAGTLVPFLVMPVLPGDTIDIDLDTIIKTHPTIGPLFGSYKWQLDIFQAGIRLYQGQLHNNKLGIGNRMGDVKLPLLTLKAVPIPQVSNVPTVDLDNAQINPSCILSYLGIRGVGVNLATDIITRDFNAVPLLMYWDIYKNYYANKQEGYGAVIHTNSAIIDSITTLDIDGVGIPQAPTVIVRYLANNSELEITHISGVPPNPDTVVLYLDGNPGTPYTLSQLFKDFIQDGPTTLRATYNFAQWGNRQITNWNYLPPSSQPVQKPGITMFTLEQIDTMRERILEWTINPTPFSVNAASLEPYSLVLGDTGVGADTRPFMMGNQEGLGLKTYQSDLLNNWIETEWIDGTNGIAEVTAIDTSGGSFTMDTLNISKKVYNMLMRIAVSGGSYDDWVEAVYDHTPFVRAESPMYMGGLSRELVFQEVISNAEAQTEDGAQPLGTLAGKGVMSDRKKGGKVVVKVSEPGYIMGIISGTPRIDYSQSNAWDIHLKTMDDFHKPALDEIGFQDSINERRAWWSTQYQEIGGWIQSAAGKVPAWIEYMTNINTVHGNFAVDPGGSGGGEQFMVLTRRYEMDTLDTGIKDLTTYIDPSKFNHIFAQKSLDAQNFWVQVAIDITARRKMSGKLMPNI